MKTKYGVAYIGWYGDKLHVVQETGPPVYAGERSGETICGTRTDTDRLFGDEWDLTDDQIATRMLTGCKKCRRKFAEIRKGRP